MRDARVGSASVDRATVNLCPSDADEAFTLIPSLKGKFTDAEMDDITKQINDKRHYDT